MNRYSYWIRSALIAIALLIPSTLEAADLTGTVKDKKGGALSGAPVLVLTTQRTMVGTATTDPSGGFRVTGLADGLYLVVVRSKGMAEFQSAVWSRARMAFVTVAADPEPWIRSASSGRLRARPMRATNASSCRAAPRPRISSANWYSWSAGYSFGHIVTHG